MEKNKMDNFYRWLAWKLPRRLVLWCMVRTFANASTGKHGDTHPMSLTYKEVYDRWEANDNGNR